MLRTFQIKTAYSKININTTDHLLDNPAVVCWKL